MLVLLLLQLAERFVFLPAFFPTRRLD